MANCLGLDSDGRKWHAVGPSNGPTTCWSLFVTAVASPSFCSTRAVASSVGDSNNCIVWDHAGFFDSNALLLFSKQEHCAAGALRFDKAAAAGHA